MHGVKYVVVGNDGNLEWKNQSGEHGEDINVNMKKGNECVIEYGLIVNE